MRTVPDSTFDEDGSGGAPSQGTCCGLFQDNPLARGHLRKGYAAMSLRTIQRNFKGTCWGETQGYPLAPAHHFQWDVLRKVSGISARARKPSKGTWPGKPQDYPFVRG